MSSMGPIAFIKFNPKIWVFVILYLETLSITACSEELSVYETTGSMAIKLLVFHKKELWSPRRS